MNKVDFDNYFTNRYEGQKKYYEGNSAKNQKKYRTFQWTLIILSALTPVLAALNTKWPDLQISVVIVSSIVAILTTGLKTFQFQELWVNSRSTIEKLNPEEYYYKFNIGDYGKEGIDKDSVFVMRVEQILSKEHDSWPTSKALADKGGKQNSESKDGNTGEETAGT